MTIDAARVDGTCYGFDLFLRDYYPGWQGWWQFPTAQNDYIYAQASINMRRLTPNTTPGLLDVGIQELVNSEVRPDTVEMCYSAALDRWTVTPNPAPPVDTTGTYKTTDGLGVQLPRTEAVTSSPFISAGMSQNGQVNSIYTTGDFRYTLNVDTHNGNFQFHADVEPYGDDPNNQFWQRVNSVSNITATLSVSR